MSRISLAMGPLLFHWTPDRIQDFYSALADTAPVDRVYLGETVCGKRGPKVRAALEAAAERLVRSGKQVVWTTLAAPATPVEARAQRARLGQGGDLVEINDVSALVQLAPKRPFVAGPLLNIYNEAAAAELIAHGCVRICGNVELSIDALAAIHRAHPALELELFAFGRLPLALSGRCYHARLKGTPKDACQFACEADPDGLAVFTLEGEPFLAVNGVQVMSHGVALLGASPEHLQRAGVGTLRISPQTMDMIAVAAALRRYCDGGIGSDELRRDVLARRPPGALVDGYNRGVAGWRWNAEP